MRARILGPALPPVNLEYVPRCAAVVSRSPPRKYFLFRSSEPKMRSSSHDSRSPDLPVKILEPDGMATATLRELLRFGPQFGSPCNASARRHALN